MKLSAFITLVLCIECMAVEPPNDDTGKKEDQKTEQQKLAEIFLSEAFLKEIESCKIESYSSENKLITVVLDDIFKLLSGKLKYLKCFKVSNSGSNKRINLSLRNSNLSVALTYIAIEARLQIKEINGLLVFTEFEIGNPEPSIAAIPLKKETASNLQITSPSTVRETLLKLGVETKAADYNANEGVLLVKTTNENIEILNLIIKLSERGYTLRVEKR